VVSTPSRTPSLLCSRAPVRTALVVSLDHGDATRSAVHENSVPCGIVRFRARPLQAADLTRALHPRRTFAPPVLLNRPIGTPRYAGDELVGSPNIATAWGLFNDVSRRITGSVTCCSVEASPSTARCSWCRFGADRDASGRAIGDGTLANRVSPCSPTCRRGRGPVERLAAVTPR